VPIQKENKAPFGSEIRGGNDRRSLSPSDSGVWESVMSVVSSPSGARDRVLAENGFIVI